MMKKIMTAWIGALLCMSELCLAAKTPLDLPYSNDIAAIVERGELRVAMYTNSDFVPFIVMNNGQPAGYDVDLSQLIARHFGVRLHIDQAASYDQAVAFVANGRDDIAVSNLTATPERALSVFFTAPYYSMPLVLVAKNNFDTSDFNLSGGVISYSSSLNIAVEANSAYSSLVKLAFPQANIIAYTDLSQAVQEVSINKYDAIFLDKITAQNIIMGDAALSIFTLGKTYVDPQTIAVNSNMPQLLFWLNNYLTSLQGQTELKTLEKKARLT